MKSNLTNHIAGERAELATEEYTSLTPIMEGFVILRKKPEEE